MQAARRPRRPRRDPPRWSTEWKPHIAFNLLEGFDDVAIFDQNVVAYLELLKLPYTGCNPRGLLLARDKSLSKKLLAYHRIPVPEFEVFRIGRPIRRPKRLAVPADREVADAGSLDRHLPGLGRRQRREAEGARHVHPREHRHDAMVEQYIDGRELYVGILGNQALQALPVWELFFTNMPEGVEADRHRAREVEREVPEEIRHRQRAGEGPARRRWRDKIQHICKRAYRALELSGYARIDLRLDEAGNVWVLEANPNPQIARGEDFAESAEKSGSSYEAVLQRILNLGLRWQPESVA